MIFFVLSKIKWLLLLLLLLLNKLAFDCTFQCYNFEKNIATDLDHD